MLGLKGLRIASFLLLIVCSQNIGAKKAKPKGDNCSRKELSLKNCRLNYKNYRLQITKEKILINDGVWRSIESLPLKSDATRWQRISLFPLGKRMLLETLIWDKPQGEGDIQSLNWIVLELHAEKLTQRLKRVIQKRRPVSVESGRKGPQERSAKSRGKTYIYDQMMKHGLKWKPGQKKIQWWVEFKKGEF